MEGLGLFVFYDILTLLSFSTKLNGFKYSKWLNSNILPTDDSYRYYYWLNFGVMAIKGYSTLPRAPGLEHHNEMQFSVFSGTTLGFFLPLSSDAVGVFYCPSRLNCKINGLHKRGPDIGLAVRVFANGPGDLGSIPGRVIRKTQKMVLDASLLNTQHCKVRIKGKVEQSRSSTLPYTWCNSYRKGSLQVTLDYGRLLYLL